MVVELVETIKIKPINSSNANIQFNTLYKKQVNILSKKELDLKTQFNHINYIDNWVFQFAINIPEGIHSTKNTNFINVSHCINFSLIESTEIKDKSNLCINFPVHLVSPLSISNKPGSVLNLNNYQNQKQAKYKVNNDIQLRRSIALNPNPGSCNATLNAKNPENFMKIQSQNMSDQSINKK